MHLGLCTRFTKEYDAWGKRRIETAKLFQQQAEILANLDRNPADIQAIVREAVIIEILEYFP
jgi:hypothetical protein